MNLLEDILNYQGDGDEFLEHIIHSNTELYLFRKMKESVILTWHSNDYISEIFYKNKENFKLMKNNNILNFLNKFFKKYNIIFRTINGGSFSEDSCGIYQAYTNRQIITIEIGELFFYWLKNFFEETLKKIQKTVSHESTHVEQYIRSKGLSTITYTEKDIEKMRNPKNEQELEESKLKYYGSKQEIMAYANDTIVILLQFGYTKDVIETFLRKKTDLNLKKYYIYREYYFKGIKESNKKYLEIGKLFFKYCYEYLQKY